MTEYETVAQVERDRWGRPLVYPLKDGAPDLAAKKIALTRCTTFIDVLEDQFNLTKWMQRMVAIGLAHRHDILLRVAAMGPMPDPVENEQGWKQWKDGLNELCDQAREAAKSSEGSNIGTALHAFAEAIDLGLEPDVPPAYRQHMDNYRKAVAGLKAVHVEEFTVQDDLKVGGTPDRVYQIDGKQVIGDIKTGSLYGLGKIKMQLALYAHSRLYNPTTGVRTDYDNMDLTRAVILPLNAKTGECEPLWVDIAQAWEDVQLCAQVRAYRGRNHHDQPPAKKQRKEPPTDLAIWIAINKAQTVADLETIWAEAAQAKRWTQAMTVRAAERKHELQEAEAKA